MPMLCPSWVLLPQAVQSMDSYLSLEKPGTLPIIIKAKTSRLGIAILISFDFLYMFYLFFPIEAKDVYRPVWRPPPRKAITTFDLWCQPARSATCIGDC